MSGGHGHVVPRPDGVKARCGGPALCGVCAKELAAQSATVTAQEPEQAARDLRAEEITREFDGWFAAQGYDEDGRFDHDEMHFAFESGMNAERDLAAPVQRTTVQDVADDIASWDAAQERPAPGPVGCWWICDNPLPDGGNKILGPFATQELALRVRAYVEKAEKREDLWVDDEPAAERPAPSLTPHDLADQAIGLFLEYQDQHGHDEPSARAAAALEVAEGAAITDDEIAGRERPAPSGEPLTHFFHCWRFPSHHACAVALIEHQAEENDRLVSSAERPAPAPGLAEVTAERDGFRNALRAIGLGIAEPSPKWVAGEALNGRYFDPMNDSGVWSMSTGPVLRLAAPLAPGEDPDNNLTAEQRAEYLQWRADRGLR